MKPPTKDQLLASIANMTETEKRFHYQFVEGLPKGQVSLDTEDIRNHVLYIAMWVRFMLLVKLCSVHADYDFIVEKRRELLVMANEFTKLRCKLQHLIEEV